MTVPFALSVHSFVNSVGAWVGLGSIVAVALLVLLYFAHARETATLRDRLDEAQQRISGLEARLAQLMQSQGAVRRAPAPVTPAPTGLRTPAPAPAAKRVPAPATAAASGSAPAAGLAAAASLRSATAVTWAPAGTAAPALASATKLIPDPAVAGRPDDTLFVPAKAAATAAAATVAAATNGQGPASPGQAASAASPGQAVSAATQAMPVAAASARTPSATPRAVVAAPPRMQLGADAPDAATATGGSGGGNRVRRLGGNSQPAAPILPSFDEPTGGRRLAGRVLPLLIGAVALAVIVAGLIVITNTGGGGNTGQVSHTNTNQTGAGLHQQQHRPIAFKPSRVTVAVLNGTAQAGLAGDIGTNLVGKGYRKGNITNAASQTESLTFVYYRPGKSNKIAAQHVARALSLSPSRVQRAGRVVLQACAISASGASLGSCTANVIVSVGQDRVNLASGG